MTRYSTIEQHFTDALGLQRRPVAIAFRNAPPADVAKLSRTEPSGCSFWRLAADGRVFYTLPGDHYNCPIGSYTHNIPLPEEREPELAQTLSLMTNVGYLRMEEVPAIPRLAETPGAIVYAPLGDTPVEPDVVLMAGQPGRLMLFQEAATRAGVAVRPLLGRPTCMAIPAALDGALVASVGCIGNRIYTELPDDEMYVALAGTDLANVAEQLGTIVDANSALTDYHRTRRAALRTPNPE